jgi:hypothetical protein
MKRQRAPDNCSQIATMSQKNNNENANPNADGNSSDSSSSSKDKSSSSDESVVAVTRHSPPPTAMKPVKTGKTLLHPTASGSVPKGQLTSFFGGSSGLPDWTSASGLPLPDQLRQLGYSSHGDTSSGIVETHMRDAFAARNVDQPKAKPVPQKSKSAARLPASAAAERNPRVWELVQDVALLTEVVEGNCFLMIKSKGAKTETLQNLRRSQGIPHGKTGVYWKAIIGKLESAHHETLCDASGKSLPLFSHALKVDYVKDHFDSLVAMRACKLEKMQAKASKSNADDWVSGKGDDSEEAKSDCEAARATVQEKDKKNSEIRDSLLDAYLAQVRAFGESSAAGESDDAAVFTSAKGGSKRPKSGQINENDDDELIEANANDDKKQSKLPKLPKLPKVTHAEQVQSQAMDHQSRVSSGFEALAVSQKPDTPEVFTAKMQSGALAISSVIASTITGAMQAWAEVKKSDRSCLRAEGHEFAPIPGTTPAIVLCKHCGMRV